MRPCHLPSALLFAAAMLSAAAEDGALDIYLTAKDTGLRLARQASAAFLPLAQPEESAATVMVDPGKRFQVIEGFGGAFTDAAAETWAKLPAAQQQAFITACFDPVDGLGYSLGRTHVHSCDFSSAMYTYTKPGDLELAGFSIAADRACRIPLIKAAAAAAGGPIKLFVSPWSPPEWMKTNASMLHGGRLKPEHRATWASYLVRFIQAYEQEGIPIWGMTVQNEPMASQTWESCLYTAEEERDFVRDHLGPALEKADLARIRLMIWDHNRGLLYQRAQVVYDDPAAARYVWGAAYHWYVNETFANVRMVHDAWPDKHLLFSEGCLYPYDAGKRDAWEHGEAYGHALINDLGNWAAGWTDWNLLLDDQGGPNHVGNYCFAPIHADLKAGTLHFTASYHYIRHFSRFVRPGARRVACTANDDALQSIAFINPDGRLVVAVMNATDRDRPFQCWIAGKAAAVPCPPHGIVTLVR